MHFLYPSDPLEPRQPDERFRNQANEMRILGLGVSIVCLEELGETTCRNRNPIPSGATVLYRGWMLAPTEYEKLLRLIHSHQASPLISLETYLACHYLQWGIHLAPPVAAWLSERDSAFSRFWTRLPPNLEPVFELVCHRRGVRGLFGAAALA